ncbi:MAG: ABC transporter ATP-binding protein [Janthinobacterium lividum]
MSDDVLLEVKDLTVRLNTPAGEIEPVSSVSFSLRRGRTLALVGESGSGKTLTCLSLLRAAPANARVISGQVRFEGEDLLGKSLEAMRQMRGERLAAVLQDATTALDPLFTIGAQIGEAFRYGGTAPHRGPLQASVIAAMQGVQIPAPEQRLHSYPHQFSGGMRQRAAMAMAMARKPTLLVADEPTTALDATIRLQMLRMLRDAQQRQGMSILFVTHDLQLVNYFCDDVAIMYAGRIVESGPVEQVFARPRHPYTISLLAAMPLLSRRAMRLAVIEGQPPAFTDMPGGCRFAPRCPHADAQCHAHYPPTQTVHAGWQAACWHQARLAVTEAVAA